jgi:hypothetical protein
MSTGIADLVGRVLGPGLPVVVRAYDGSVSSPPDPVATLVVRSPDAIRRVVTSPGDLGLGRAYVAGDLDVEGDLLGVLTALRESVPKVDVRALADLALSIGPGVLRPPAPPHEEARLRGRLHSKERDVAAITHHYDVSNGFYGLVLGPSMTYSCAVWANPDLGLEARHAENLREHYALTLRAWVANLEERWEAAVAEVGEGRARVWRLYMSACAVAFDAGAIQIQKVLATKNDRGASRMPLRPSIASAPAPAS